MSSSDDFFKSQIRLMMFASGEKKATDDTVQLMHDYAKQFVQDLARKTAARALICRSRSKKPEHLLFCIRHEPWLVSAFERCQSFKTLRKNANKALVKGDEVEAVLDDDDVMPDVQQIDLSRTMAITKVPWDFVQGLTAGMYENEEDDTPIIVEDEEKERQLENIARLKVIDDYTKGLTKREYLEYIDAAKASFTAKHPVKFEEWVPLTAYKFTREVVDILGYLGRELIRELTTRSTLIRNRAPEQKPKRLKSLFSLHEQPDNSTDRHCVATAYAQLFVDRTVKL